ncbi:DNA modification methylase [Mucilaginibacter sp. UYP25]|uniref:DNA methyltransferase n=1 Tax=unclassified Mucilaginibacter TaxID=2617802 RepID=UPI0033908D36
MKTSYIQSNAVVKVKTSDLSIHPVLSTIYTYSDVDAIEELGRSMLEVGQLQPVTADSQMRIRSGGRRFKAALNAGIEFLDVIIVDTDNSNEALVTVFSNQHRTKTLTEKINEAEILLELIGKNQGKRNDLLKEYDNVLGKGNRFDKAARVIGGISESSLRKLFAIVEFEKISPAHKEVALIENMITKDISIDRTHSMMESVKPTLAAQKIVGKIISLSNVIEPRLTSFLAPKKETNNENATVVSLPVADRRRPFITENVRLYNQSCIDLSVIEPESLQVVFTSPPYSGLRNYSNGPDELGLENSVDEYVKNLLNHLRDVKKVLKKDGSFFLNIGESYEDGCAQMVPTKVVLALVEKEGWKLINEIVWAKTNSIPNSNDKRLKPTCEKIFHLVLDTKSYYYNEFKVWNDSEIKIVSAPNDRNTKETGKKKSGYTLTKPYFKLKDFMDGQNVENVIKGHNASMRQKECKKLDSTKDHPALMPTYLPIIPILLTSRPGDVVLDIFSGSGTTGVAALALDRNYIGIELNPDNFDLSIKQFTQNNYAAIKNAA